MQIIMNVGLKPSKLKFAITIPLDLKFPDPV